MSDRIVMAHRLAMAKGDDDPLRSLREALVFSSNDWGSAPDFAWIYGIVCGWGDEDEDYYPSLQADFGWSDEQIARLKRLHAAFVDLEGS